MVRAPRDFGTLREEIRRLINETSATNPGLDNALILDVFNRKKDYREMQLQDTGEGFSVTWHDADIVAGQTEYSLPAQVGRLRKISRYIASETLYVPLEREEKNTEPTYVGGSFGDESYLPNYRLVDNHIILSPPPTEDITNGLRIEMEAATDRIVNDDDCLPDSWPLFAETLLVYDTVMELYNAEFSQGIPPEGILTTLANDLARYEGMWLQYVDKRSFGPTYTEPFYVDILT